MKVKPRVMNAINTLGNKPICQYVRAYDRLVDTILPRLGVGSSMPSPKKLRPASLKIAAGIWNATRTAMIGMTLGNMCIIAIRSSLAPMARAATTNSRSLNAMN